jgi:hypothetical protein
MLRTPPPSRSQNRRENALRDIAAIKINAIGLFIFCREWPKAAPPPPIVPLTPKASASAPALGAVRDKDHVDSLAVRQKHQLKKRAFRPGVCVATHTRHAHAVFRCISL